MWIIKDIPMSYTVNQGHLVSRNRIIKTNIARVFDKSIDLWIIKNAKIVAKMRTEIAAAIAQGFQLKVISYLCFPKEELWTKKSDPKRIDVNNRMKPLCDAIAKIIGVDDKHFFQHQEEKVEADGAAHIVVAIGAVKPNMKSNLWISSKDQAGPEGMI